MPDAVAIPILLRANQKTKNKKRDDGNGEFGSIVQEAAPAYKTTEDKTTANLSSAARAYLAKTGLKNPDENEEEASSIWMHALAISYSNAYLKENADGIRQDCPSIPLPATIDLLLESAKLGGEVAALLDSETPMAGVPTELMRLAS